MNKSVIDLGQNSQRIALTPQERNALHAERYLREHQHILAWLEQPFMETLRTGVMHKPDSHYAKRQAQEIFLLCRQIMRDLNMTYWGFTWDLLLSWQTTWAKTRGVRPTKVRYQEDGRWTQLTETLLLMKILPYSEHICRIQHTAPAILWLGAAQAAEIQETFQSMARKIGYQGPQLRLVSRIVLCILALNQKRSLAELTLADVRTWQSQTIRPGHGVRDCATLISRTMAALGYWTDDQMALSPRRGRDRFNWGATSPKLAQAFQRFLDDIAPLYRPNSWVRYRLALRRFGDWLGERFPEVICLSQIRREHIEAYKHALASMRKDEHAIPRGRSKKSKPDAALGRASQRQLLSNLRAFFQRLEVLEYPERPSTKLWASDDLPPEDEPLPRFIPDEDWHRLLDTIEHLDRLTIRHGHYPLTYLKSLTTLLFGCGMRGGELCRLDTGCLVVATGKAIHEETYWLRVPLGKLHNDRIIPVNAAVVTAIDAWVAERGPQPARRDERTGQLVDFLFTYRGAPLGLSTLNHIVQDICQQAKTQQLYTSHNFRHTVATKWRNKGMPLDTISKLLGHKSLEMTLRYSAIMPPTLRQEFEEAFAAIAEEYRAVAKVRVVLSPEAHLEAQRQWHEAMWVDLGIGWCGLSAYLPCDSRLKCQRCPNFIPDKHRLPLLEEQRQHLIELRGLDVLPPPQRAEMKQAVTIVEENIRIAQCGQFAESGRLAQR